MNANHPLSTTALALLCVSLFACADDASTPLEASTGDQGDTSETTSTGSTGNTTSGSSEPTGSESTEGEASTSSSSSTGTSASSSSGGPAEYQEALDFVISQIDEAHRGTLDGRPAAVEAAVTQSLQDVETVSTDFEFERLVGRLLVSLEDGHSRVGPTAQAQETLGSIDLPMLWLEGGPVVVTSTSMLDAGDSILSIGGVSTDAMLLELAEHVSRDNDGYLRHAAPLLVPREDWLEPLGAVVDGNVSVEFERDGATMTVDLPLVPGLQVDPAPDREFVGYTIEAENSLGVFHLDNCIYDETYQSTLDAFMAEVQSQDLDKIAIDLRYNGGGDVTVAYALLNYLAADYLSFSVSARKSDALFEQALLYSNRAFLGLLTAFDVDLEGPTFEVPGEALSVGLGAAVPPVEPGNRFAGDVYLLVSPTTYSSAQLFVGQIVDNGLGTTVGDQTGANRNSTGDMLRIDVPGTEVQITLGASFQSRPATGQEQGETLADIQAPRTREDILSGIDPALEAVRGL